MEHTGLKKLDNQSNVCPLCSKKLSSTSARNRHMLTHSGERPFKCTLCSSSFTTNGNMHRHMRSHAGKKKPAPTTHTVEIPTLVTSIETRSRKRKLSKSETDPIPSAKRKRDDPDTGRNARGESSPLDGKKSQKCNPTRGGNAHRNSRKKSRNSYKDKKAKVGLKDLFRSEFSTIGYPFIAKHICEESTGKPLSSAFVYKCSACGKAFPSSRSLELHEAGHVSTAATPSPKRIDNLLSSNDAKNHPVEQTPDENSGSQCSASQSSDMSHEQESFLDMLGLRGKEKISDGNCDLEEKGQPETIAVTDSSKLSKKRKRTCLKDCTNVILNTQ